MEQQTGHQAAITMHSCDGDPTIREGDWLRLWNSHGVGVAHDVWVSRGGIVYENSGPHGGVRRNFLANVLTGRKVAQIVARTAPHEFMAKIRFAESMLGTPWDVSYTCQDFASEVACGRAESFQRDGVLALTAMGVGLVLLSNYEHSNYEQQRRSNRKRSRTN